ncbi:MAG TPA: response regulator [Bacteroidia bacterium]|jgi:PAS domain S-box-containing protein|nr:response regulator [Bacteroidia bacterium]
MSEQEYRDQVKKKLELLIPIFNNAAKGDFSADIRLPDGAEADEFTVFFAGIQQMIEVARQQLAELKQLNTTLGKKVEERTAEITAKNELLNSQTQLYQTLLNAQSEMGEGVAITEGSRFVYFNEALLRIYGYKKEELMELDSFFDIIAPELREKLKARLMQRLSGEKSSDSGETQVIRKDGSRVFIEYSLKPVMSGNKRQLISIIRDVTRKKQTEEFLRKERKRSEQAELAQDISEKFLANISHEIRTPMNAIVGFAKLLGDSPLNEEQKKYSDIIRKSGENLLVIINDILDLSRLREGKIKLERKNFTITELVRSSLQVLSASAEKKNISLRSLVDPRLKMPLIGDPVRLGQILLNLLSNAVKFTDKGEIAVSCAMLDEQHDRVEVGFTVSDTGKGIAIEELPYIFDRFGKAVHSDSKLYEGTGIGLAISRHLVELQGGEITVSSGIGEGTSFHYTLSFEKSREGIKPNVEQEEDLSPADSGLEARILLVEDNEMNRELIRILCERWNFVLDTAEDGRSALNSLDNGTYDLVLMDLKLPEMSGYEVTQHIRNRKKFGKIPIIAVTAHAIEGEREKCIAAGMNDYVSKPIDPKVLRSKIISLISQNGKQDHSENARN